MIICNKAYRKMRYALHKVSILFCILFVSCEWVNDDYSDCPTGTWLHFSYTYNILDVDAAYNQVDDLSIFIFDYQGKFIDRRDIDSLEFQQNSAMVEIEQPQGEYKVLVWGGLSDANYNLPDMIVGETLYEDVILTLSSSDEASENSDLLSYLFHYNSDSVIVPDYYNVIEAPLVKNTNHFSILIQSDNYEELNESDFGVVIRSDNGAIDYSNSVVNGNYINYTPYEQYVTEVTNTSLDGESEISSLFVSYLNTLQLMVDDDTSMSIVHTATDDRLIDISLTQYLILTSGYYSAGVMEQQEYLDRQDSYSLILFLESCDSSPSGYICTKVSVNGWIVRFNEAELTKN